jgi:hypothetical protein
MLFRSRGWPCKAATCQALARMAGSKADDWKVEDHAGRQPQPTGEQPQPELIDTSVEQQTGWSRTLNGQPLESEPAQKPLQALTAPRSSGLRISLGVVDIWPKMRFATFESSGRQNYRARAHLVIANVNRPY